MGERQGEEILQSWLRDVEEHNGLDYIDALQTHPDNEVYEMAVNFLSTYFNGC
jgi:hypothetical protein